MATDKITVDGDPVGFMYRDQPEFEHDSGWKFLAGTEDQDYAGDADNWLIYDVNTIANYDPTIIKYLESPIGTALERVKGINDFRKVDL
jgi:hypothetical protein